jgi:hypothetical protein
MVHTRVGGTPLLCPNTLTHYHSTCSPRRTRHSSYHAEKLRHVACSISGVVCAKAAVIFCWRWSSFRGLCPYASDLTYPHTKNSGVFKSREFASHGMDQSWPHQWFLYVSKTPALWEPNVAESYMDILHANIQTNCSEICKLISCIQRFTFLTSQTNHSVYNIK